MTPLETALRLINATRLPGAARAASAECTLESIGFDPLDRATVSLAIEDECRVRLPDWVCEKWRTAGDVAETIEGAFQCHAS